MGPGLASQYAKKLSFQINSIAAALPIMTPAAPMKIKVGICTPAIGPEPSNVSLAVGALDLL
ncbi:hypothetical protein AWB79_02653 [Caballeronia hypogeia]|uniref:Uncharacterized protein n=1 Tax=Caballeronia hypogeia TaxID=1777140 RepID=A0A158AQQ5_9BURK|nr:hypothetical protein AWB79_02653 [Caballeronia hypogeia]